MVLLVSRKWAIVSASLCKGQCQSALLPMSCVFSGMLREYFIIAYTKLDLFPLLSLTHHSCNKYLLSNYYNPHSPIGTWGTKMNKESSVCSVMDSSDKVICMQTNVSGEVFCTLYQKYIWDLRENVFRRIWGGKREEYSEQRGRKDLPCKTAFLVGKIQAVKLDEYEIKSQFC